MAPKTAAAVAATASATRPKRVKRPSSEEAAPAPAANTSKKRKVEPKAAPAKVTKKTATKASTAKTLANKPAAKKAAPKPAASTKNTANTSKKRKSEDDVDDRPAKKASVSKAGAKKAVKDAKPAAKKAASKAKAAPKKAAPKAKPAPKAATPAVQEITKGPVINKAPTQRLDVLVFGEGSAGELGLGTAKNVIDVKRPRLNPNLPADKVGVVQLAAGGMHVVALTADNKILTWGVNDGSALGRDTTWDGGLRDMDKEDDDSDDEDSGLNPKEATPTEVDFSDTLLAKDTRWTQVAAGDSCSFAVTDDGKVYGWGSFRSNEGATGFTPSVDVAKRPLHIPELKNIISIACGANHAVALDNKGAVFVWGSGEQNQLGRRIIERYKRDSLRPRQLGLPRGAKTEGIKAVASGEYHSFALGKKGTVFAWGLNSFCETGILNKQVGEDEAVIKTAQQVPALKGRTVVSIDGGSHHSIAATADGDCLVWGRLDSGQCGIAEDDLLDLGDEVRKNARGKPALLPFPAKAEAVEGHAVAVSAGPDHSLVVTKEGKAYSTGFSSTYQTGQGTEDEIQEFTLIDNGAVRERTLTSAHAGGQFSALTAIAK